MDVHQSDDLEIYATAVIPFLEAEPCTRNVLRSIIEIGRQGSGAWQSAPSFWWLSDGAAVRGAACLTPPWNLLVSAIPTAALAELARHVAAYAERRGWRVAGVTGPRDDAAALAGLLSASLHANVDEPRHMLLHELTAVNDVAHPGGARRRATAADVALVAAWMRAFGRELEVPGAEAEASVVSARIAGGLYDVWEVAGAPVSMSAHTQPLAGVVRIASVYTPPEHRLHGYARRLVAEVSAEALGVKSVARCMLYTEARNPVSNAIYRQIGYTQIEEHADIRFKRAQQ